MNSPVRIRPVQKSDYPAILEITRAEFPAAASVDSKIEDVIGGMPWHIIKADRLMSELKNNPEACAVAECDGRVAGYVTNVIDPVARRGIIANLAVTHAMQGRGIGQKLIEWSLHHFRFLGLEQAKIETLETNEAGRHLYPKLGFREVVRQIHYVMPLQTGNDEFTPPPCGPAPGGCVLPGRTPATR